jgi:hypothetical protein
MPALRIDTPQGTAIAMSNRLGKPIELQHYLSVVTTKMPSLIKEKLVGFQSVEDRLDGGDTDEHVIVTNIEAYAHDETGVPFNWDAHYDPGAWFLGIKRPNGVIMLFNNKGLIGVNQYQSGDVKVVDKKSGNVSTMFPKGSNFVVED